MFVVGCFWREPRLRRGARAFCQAGDRRAALTPSRPRRTRRRAASTRWRAGSATSRSMCRATRSARRFRTTASEAPTCHTTTLSVGATILDYTTILSVEATILGHTTTLSVGMYCISTVGISNGLGGSDRFWAGWGKRENYTRHHIWRISDYFPWFPSSANFCFENSCMAEHFHLNSRNLSIL